MEESESRIILALDVTEREKAINISSEMSDYISFIKINWPLILSAGVGIVSDISRIKPVICDLKLADIPNTHRLITGIIKRSGAYGVIAHSFVGSDSLQEISKTEPSLKVFSVVAMSHKGASEVMDQQRLLLGPILDRKVECIQDLYRKDHQQSSLTVQQRPKC